MHSSSLHLFPSNFEIELDRLRQKEPHSKPGVCEEFCGCKRQSPTRCARSVVRARALREYENLYNITVMAVTRGIQSPRYQN
jgi:hypothetical protein